MRAAIEQATCADIPALIDLMNEFYAESNYALDRKWAEASFERLLTESGRGAAWIARCDSQPAGHVVLTLRHSMEFGGLAGTIDDLFVRPQFRRQGIASALLSALFDACRELGVEVIDVEVGSNNAAASALYERFGLGAGDDGRCRLRVKLDTVPWHSSSF